MVCTPPPQSVLVGFVDTLISLIEEACKNWVRFKQYFAIFADVVDFGDAERCVELTLFLSLLLRSHSILVTGAQDVGLEISCLHGLAET